MICYVLGVMGLGKTAFTSLYALQFSKDNPNSMIYANYHLSLKNFIYTPYMFLPFSKLDKCLIIADDFYTLKNLKGFTSTCVNLSRKANLDILLTAQYYTMIPKEIRDLSDELRPFINKINRTLYYVKITPENDYSMGMVNNIFEKLDGLYDTNEIVKFNRLDKIANEIIKHSSNLEDLLDNIELYGSSQAKIKGMLKLVKANPKSKKFFK